MSFESKSEQGFSIRAQTVELGGTRLGYRGFRMGFANGYAISVQFGTPNYCSENNGIASIPKGMKSQAWLEATCPDAEIAIISPDGKFVPFKDGNDVRGHTPPDSLAEIIAWVVKQPSNSK
jgi:hypothetical protein